MNMLTRCSSFPTEDEARQGRQVYASRFKKHKQRGNGIDGFLGSYKFRETMSFIRTITSKELDFYLYGRNDVLPVKLEEGSPGNERERQQRIAMKIPNYESPLSTITFKTMTFPCFPEKSVDILQLRYKPGVEKEFRSSEEFNKVLAAIKNIPPQLNLCYSSIPGAGFGICATEVIPSGTWVGPYEGQRVSIQEISSMLDTRYVWEVYKNGVLDHGINGMEVRDSSSWSWMKYIQCGRNIIEQNAVAFQFGADIYFRTYKTIQPGEEMLVWYAEYYEQHHGIPIGVRKLEKTKDTTQFGKQTKKAPEMIDQRSSEQNSSMIKPAEEPEYVSHQKLCTAPITGLPSLTSHHSKVSHIKHPASKLHPPAETIHQVENEPPKSLSPEYMILSPTSGHQATVFSEKETSKQPVIPSPKPIVPSKKPVMPTAKPVFSDAKPVNPNAKRAIPVTSSEGGESTRLLKTRFWKCEHCFSKFPQKWALQVHSCPCEVTKPYRCSSCRKTYRYKDDIQAHVEHCGGGKQYKCGYCGRSFVNVNILSKHLRVHSLQTVVTSRRKNARVTSYQRFFQ